MGTTWYVDPERGRDGNDGRDPGSPLPSHAGLAPGPGDAVLFRRGTSLRGAIESPDGAPGAPVVWGAFGEGPAPRILGSAGASRPADWLPDAEPGVWRLAWRPGSEVCNVVFDGGASCGVLDWGLGLPSAPDSDGAARGRDGAWRDEAAFSRDAPPPDARVLMRSPVNPALAHPGGIELCLRGTGRIASARRHVRFEGLSFEMGGCHGFQGIGAEGVEIRHCSFRFLGGQPWHRGSRIRYGNAAEFWDGARDCSVEGCDIAEIFDSCLTTQGPHGACRPFVRLRFAGNRIRGYGMAALEIRDTVPSGLVFEGNDCSDAGGGFSARGDGVPRLSEIWPEPMGHHVFAWRLDTPGPGGSVVFRGNRFHGRPRGAAFYAHAAHPGALAQFAGLPGAFAGTPIACASAAAVVC